MISFHNITTVARYEAKTLRRSWLFRLFSIGAVFILTIMNIGVFSPVGDENWETLAISTSIPHINLYMLNIAQALVIVFLASDFLKRDKKLDTNEVLYTRPVSNFEYITGKSLGILRLFIGLNFLILLIALVINIIARNTVVDLMAYVSSLLIISIPTLLFSLGFAYIVMTLVRNQSVTFLLLIGYAALNIFYLWFRAGSVFDYMLFGMPVFKSQMVGYTGLNMIVAQRLLYTFAGLAFIMVTILFFKRLPQSISQKTVTIILLVFFGCGAFFSGYYFYREYSGGKKTRQATLEINRQYEDENFLVVTSADITVEHNGEEINAEAHLVCSNTTGKQVERLVYTLNPGLVLSEVTVGNEPVPFERNGQIIIITPEQPVNRGDSVKVGFTYAGKINAPFINPWHNPDPKNFSYTIGPVRVNQVQLFIDDDYLLLTPDTYWYPTATLNYYPTNPARIKVDFTRYSLKAKPEEGLIAISQGESHEENGYTLFRNETPLTGLTLVEGKYKKASLIADSINYTAYYYDGHDYYNKDLDQLADTLTNLVSNIMDELVTSFGTEFPYSRLSFVEVPVQFNPAPRKNTQTNATAQPSMILLPEKLATVNNSGFYRNIKRQKRRMERSNMVLTDKEMQVRIFNQFVRGTFITSNSMGFNRMSDSDGSGKFLLGPSFYFFKNNFYSKQYPVINAVFESNLQRVSNATGFARGFLGGLSENDRANTILKGTSLKELLATDPSYDTLRIVLGVKGDYLFNLIRSKAGITEFNDWFASYVEDNRFRNIDLNLFCNELKAQFGFDLMPYIKQWYEGTEQPGFYFTDLKTNEVVIGNRTRYKVSFVASNPTEVAGLFNVSFRTGGRGGGGMRDGAININISRGGGTIAVSGGRGMQADDAEKIVTLEPEQAKRINIILDAQPRAIIINTLSSMNNPGTLTMPITEVLKERNISLVEEDETIDKIPPFTEENEIIVDNEDAGFRIHQPESTSRLKAILGITSNKGSDYSEMFSWWAPEYWQNTVQSGYYGKFIKSAVYTRAGAGERSLSWTAPIKEPGYYDIYAYVSKQGRGGFSAGQGRSRRGSNTKDLHFNINHDDGNEEVTIEYENSENGWNLLGSYYLSPDSATVFLSNKSEGRTVTGDAIKWVKQQ